MASRFWVGGTGNWDAATTTNWSATSGGGGGASVPGVGDSATFDAASGGGTVTVTATQSLSSITAGAFTGTLDTNGQTITLSATFTISGTGARTITLGASVINIGNSWAAATTTNLTFNANTSTITVPTTNTTGTVFAGGSLTYSTVVINGATGAQTISGSNTFSTLTITGASSTGGVIEFTSNQVVSGTLTINGNSATNRLLLTSGTIGTPRTLTAATVVATNVDFKDITGAGASSWDLSAITGGSGDAGGNSVITFTTPTTRYWVGGTGSWSSTGEWSATSGGGSGASVPLCHDDVVFDANSFSAGSQTCTANMPRLGKSIDWTNVTNTPTWTTSTTASIFGSLTLAADMTLTASTQTYTFEGRSSYTLTSANKSWAKTISINAPGGTYTLQDNLTTTGTSLSPTFGTLDANDYNISAPNITSASNAILIMGSGTWTVTNQGSSWSTSGAILVSETSTLKFTDSSSGSLTFAGGGSTYYNVWFARGASTGSITVTGSNSFTSFKDDGSVAHSILFTTGTTQHVSTWNVSGSSGQEITINSTTTGTHALIKDGGGTVTANYLNIQHSVATPTSTWYAINSTNNQAVATAGSGWFFPFAYNLVADVGSFVLTGSSVNLSRGYTMVASVGSFVLTGIDTALIYGRRLIAETGSFVLTGFDISLNKGYNMLAEAGSFVLTGVSNSIQVARHLFAEVGTFTLTGNPVRFLGSVVSRMVNDSRPSSSMINSTKVSIGETWGTITTTWANETRTWLEASQLIDNTSKPTTVIENIPKP